MVFLGGLFVVGLMFTGRTGWGNGNFVGGNDDDADCFDEEDRRRIGVVGVGCRTEARGGVRLLERRRGSDEARRGGVVVVG
mmetsp:Transcript_15897/g.32872  ORF Transcript_15897/g.32872 Transcript_15897/m.32872 type:complete len:81 (-) Transcript_15897:240-482(-)